MRAGTPRARAARLAIASVIGLSPIVAASVAGQEPGARDTTGAERPFVRGGPGDRPYLTTLAGRLAIGGYAEGHARYEREDGITDELGFEARRFNLFFNSQVSDFIRFGAELEFEDAAEEILLEYLTVDLLVHPAFGVRAGMLLLPLGRFNLAHDSPRNPFTDRPLVSTGLLAVALSQPGLGAFGAIPLRGTSRVTYEAYAVNGFDDRILDSEDGVRLPRGRRNFENDNRRLSVVGRVAFSPDADLEVGASGMHGQYNRSTLDGETIDEARHVSVGALDWELDRGLFRIAGEAAIVHIDVPPALEGLLATDQWGAYTDVVVPFGRAWIAGMDRSSFEAKARLDVVDFDRDNPGDDEWRISIGLNFRPTSDTAFKLDYYRGRVHDRFQNATERAGILFSAATYF